MSKRMKLGFSGLHEDAKTRLKYQTLLQDYHHMQMETDRIRNKLDNVKKRKMILLAEVRFLRLRHKNLLEENYGAPKIHQKAHKKTNPKLSDKKKLHDKTPLFDLNQISREELEIQRAEGMKRSVATMKEEANEEQAIELKLGMCRSVGNEIRRTGGGGGKRKISWQDPVALKV